MAARVVAYGREERLPKGTLVFARGERSVDFFFVLEGDIEIFDLAADWRAQRLHGARRTAIYRRALGCVAGRAG
jgi:thioredoxin reductase (NADPH)